MNLPPNYRKNHLKSNLGDKNHRWLVKLIQLVNDGSYNSFMKYFLFGRSQNGLAIDAISFGSIGKHVLILGGVHGDEIEGVALAKFLVAELGENLDFPLMSWKNYISL